MPPAPTTTSVQPNAPGPLQDRPTPGTDAPSRTGRLLGLVRTLIDRGKQLATTLQQRTATTNLSGIIRNFGTIDIADIVARITRGLLRAAALEAKLDQRLARQQAQQAAAAALTAPSTREPRAPRPTTNRSASAPEDQGVAHLPTPEAIAAEIRRRPIGAVIADIIRDLGIVPSDPLWRELAGAVLEHGGNLSALFTDTCNRIAAFIFNPPPEGHPEGVVPPLPPWLESATGPP
jgi:hypothetical protein